MQNFALSPPERAARLLNVSPLVYRERGMWTNARTVRRSSPLLPFQSLIAIENAGKHTNSQAKDNLDNARAFSQQADQLRLSRSADYVELVKVVNELLHRK